MKKSGLIAKIPPSPATGIIMLQKGRQRKIYYNPTWKYYKNYTKEQLAKLELKALSGLRKNKA